MLNIRPIPAFSDNYIWLVTRDDSRDAFVVDPGDGAVVEETLRHEGLNLTGILVTHHHFDHVGGVARLRDRYAPVVYGPENPGLDDIDERVGPGDQVDVLGDDFTVMAVPGHTLDHIAYFHRAESPILFCGDTLFAGGCGRVFEGTPAMMHGSLQALAALPGNTRVYCAHEYTLANLAFALAVEPDNQALQARASAARATREAGQPTVPSTLALELATNPFLRCEMPELQAALRRQGRLRDTAADRVFAEVRAWKDTF